MSSRSATVLVIFIVAIIAFCLACVCASITGPISILPNESNSGGILDNLSAITDDNVDSYDNQYSDDYSYSSSSDSYSSYNVETTVDQSDSSDVETVEDHSVDSSSEPPSPPNQPGSTEHNSL